MDKDDGVALGPAQYVRTERRGAVLVVTLDKPERLNALSPLMVRQLGQAWDTAGTDDEIRAVVLTGAGRGFCAGADLKADPAVEGPADLRQTFNPMLLELAAVGKPVIAAVNGAAAGAGLGLACAADLRIASTEATFIPAFARIGVAPDMGASYHLPRIIGYDKSLVWLLSGRPMSAQEALGIGLVTALAEPEGLLDQAIALAGSLVGSTRTVVRYTRELLRAAQRSTLAQHLEREADVQALTVADPERAELRARVVAELGGAADADTEVG